VSRSFVTVDHGHPPLHLRTARKLRGKPRIWTAADRDYETLRIGMQTLFQHVGIETQPAAA
jgi:hypothetical protein